MGGRQPHKIHPTHEQWEVHRERIRDLYLGQGLTCRVVAKVMLETHGFDASERMYKQRFGTWNFEPKRAARPFYQAMDVVAQQRLSQGLRSQFRIRKGLKWISRSHEQVRKELKRSGKIQPMTTDEAWEIIHRRQIRVETPLMDSDDDVDSSGSEWSDVSDDAERGSERQSTSASNPAAFRTRRTPPCRTTRLPRLHEIGLLPSPSLLGQPPGHLAPNDGADKDRPSLPYDFLSTFDKLSIESLHCSAASLLPRDFGDTFQIFLPMTAPQQKIAAGEWAAPFYLSCEADLKPLNFELCKQRAMKIFAQMIKSNSENDYIFPCLNWMVTVLGSNGHGTLLKDFLSESCRVIDESHQHMNYGEIFHYALAVCEDDKNAVEKHGGRFAQSHERILTSFNHESPNVLVSLYYWAWDLISKKEYEAVMSLLRRCLPVSERVMGRRDLVTINCLVMLCRAYADNGQIRLAIDGLRDAAERLGDPRKPLRAYKLMIVGRLAECLIRVENYAEAEFHLQKVVEGRLELLGWQDGDAWGAIDSLRLAIERQRGVEAGRAFWDNMLQRYQSA